MKKSVFIAMVMASFVGVLLALQADRFLARKTGGNGPDVTITRGLAGTPVDYAPSTGAPSDFRAAAKKVLPSVVSVDKYQEVQRFMEESQVQETATGSGVIISSDGTIVTNNHVVAGAAQVRVRLSDKRTVVAKVIGTDPRADLAVLKVDAGSLTPIEMGDSSALEVGQWVIAVGNPLGYDQTVSVGVVSNKSRSLPSEGAGVLLNAIQTDAAINPGNSGGALTDADGRLVGINAAIISNTGTSIGIGFAIPVNRVKRVVSDILKYGHTRYGMLGLAPDPRFDGLLSDEQGRSELSQATGSDKVPSEGLLVPPYVEQDGRRYASITPGLPADEAGIKPLDVILTIDGQPVTDRLTLYQLLNDKQAGDKVTVKYWTKGVVKTAVLTLAPVPAEG